MFRIEYDEYHGIILVDIFVEVFGGYIPFMKLYDDNKLSVLSSWGINSYDLCGLILLAQEYFKGDGSCHS